MIWLPEVGVFLLLGSIAFSLCGFFSHQRFWVSLQGYSVVLAFLLLCWLFYACDFSVAYVYSNSNTGLPWYYRLSAVWGAHEGSLLLWLLWLNVWTTIVVSSKRWEPIVQRYAVGILSGIHSIFALFIISLSNPFARILPVIPKEGADLNPLLQDIGLILHPPILYGGYVGFSVPFAIVVALLWKGNPDTPWSRWLEPWVIASLVFLTAGITLGSWWAYYELGWGGWWFWDPVENASFMPWLSGIALLHLLVLHKVTRAHSAWCLLVAIFTFGLCLIGTFLVRSGIVTSVHAFASDPGRGLFILVFIAVILGFAVTVYALRVSQFLNQTSRMIFIKAKLFLGAISLMLAACATVLLGTLYPLLVDALVGQKLSVGPPYFDTVFVPFMIPLLLLCSFLPSITWGKSLSFLKEGRWTLSALGVVSLLIAFWLPEGKHWWVTFGGVWGASFLCLSTLKTLWVRAKNTGQISYPLLGMGLAHVGLAVLVSGISLTTHLDLEKDLRLKTGDNVTLRQWTFKLDGFKRSDGGNYQGVQAEITVLKEGVFFTKLYPEKRYYTARDISITETALSPGLLQDLYVALSEPIARDEWVFRIYLKPFVRWLWLGGLMMALGLCVTQIKNRKAVGLKS
jgi:cytochrome c-type biogenesis protein CcmF